MAQPDNQGFLDKCGKEDPDVGDQGLRAHFWLPKATTYCETWRRSITLLGQVGIKIMQYPPRGVGGGA